MTKGKHRLIIIKYVQRMKTSLPDIHIIVTLYRIMLLWYDLLKENINKHHLILYSATYLNVQFSLPTFVSSNYATILGRYCDAMCVKQQ